MASQDAIIVGAGDLVQKQAPHFCTSAGPNMLTSTHCRSAVVGLAAARRLAALGYRVTVLETESDSDHHTSARGSWVIHSGLYYPPGSLKVGCTHLPLLRCSRRCISEQCAERIQSRLSHARKACDDMSHGAWLQRRHGCVKQGVTCCTSTVLLEALRTSGSASSWLQRPSSRHGAVTHTVLHRAARKRLTLEWSRVPMTLL